MPSYILALDLGSAKIKALISQLNSANTWQVVFPVSHKSQGIKQGMINNLEMVNIELDSMLNEIEGINRNFVFKQAAVGIGGLHLDTKVSKGVSVISRPDGEITEDDKERALKAAQACVLPANRILVQTIIKNYTIDGIAKTRDPLLMKGLRLEIECLLIDAFSPIIRNLDRLGEMVGLHFNHFILPYAGAELALTQQDKELGAAALDLGAGTTSLCVYEDDELLDLKVFPIGGNNITNDIAVGLKTYVDVAEKIKINEGIALAKKTPKGSQIDLNQYLEEVNETDEENKINRRFLAEIIEARLNEIFEMAGARLKELNCFGKLPGGIVLSGGGAKMPFVVDLAKEKFKLPVRIAKPDIEWYKENPDPSFISVLGMTDLTFRSMADRGFNRDNIFQKTINIFKKHFSF